MSEHIQIITTTEKREDAERIAGALLEKRLAACIQIIGPIESMYRWKGEVVKGEEWLCVIKSRAELYEVVEKIILEMHPYEVPEIIAVPITAGFEQYLKWMDEETGRR